MEYPLPFRKVSLPRRHSVARTDIPARRVGAKECDYGDFRLYPSCLSTAWRIVACRASWRVYSGQDHCQRRNAQARRRRSNGDAIPAQCIAQRGGGIPTRLSAQPQDCTHYVKSRAYHNPQHLVKFCPAIVPLGDLCDLGHLFYCISLPAR